MTRGRRESIAAQCDFEPTTAMGTYCHTQFWKECITSFFASDTTLPRGLIDCQPVPTVLA
jgi:hypothetical protein